MRYFSIVGRSIMLGLFFLSIFLRGDVFAAGAETSQAPREVQKKSVFGQWQVICDPVSAASKKRRNCRVSQSVVTEKSKARVFMLQIYQSKVPVALATTPIGIFLKPGLVLQIDDDKAQVFSFETCDEEGCHTGIALTRRMLGRFSTGKVAVFHFFDGAQNKIAIPVNLEGFGKAYNEMVKK